MAKKQDSKTVPCPDCGGRGVQSFGDQDVDCATCSGKGTVKG